MSSPQPAVLEKTIPATFDLASLRRWLPFAIISLLLVLLYYKVTAKLIFDWYDLPDYSHGFLVPFFALFLLWESRNTLRSLPLKPTWAGLSLIVPGLFVLILGVYGADLFLSRTSFLILLSGLIWTFFGAPMLKAVRFPLFVLLLAIPFPAIVFNQITFPLQLLASKLASATLPLLGVPVLNEGNVIELPVMKLEVAEACSGIRSLMSLFTLSVFYGYFLERTTPTPLHPRLRQHPHRRHRECPAYRRHRPLRPILGPRKSPRLLS